MWKCLCLETQFNKFCPYFTEMGLKQVPVMEQGSIDIYKFGEHVVQAVAVEYCSTIVKQKASNKYFALIIKIYKW